MTKEEYGEFMKRHGIRNKEFTETVWKRLGQFSERIEEKDFKPILLLFLKNISKTRKQELSRP